MQNINFSNIVKKSWFIGLSIFFLSLTAIFNAYGTAGVMNLMGYGSGSDYTSPSSGFSGSISVSTGETLTGATQVTLNQPVQVVSGNVNVVIPNGTQITTSLGTIFNPQTISTYVLGTLPVSLPSNEQDVGKIKFGIDGVKLNFTKPVKLQIPVSTTNSTVRIKVKHAGFEGYQTFALTDTMASNCFNGYATPSSNIASVSNGIATIYTCSASDFIAITDKAIVSSGGGGGGGIYKDSCPSGDFSPSYYDRSCGTSPVVTKDDEISVIVKEVVDAISQSNIQTIPNTTTNQKIRFKYIVQSKVETLKYSGYDVKVIPGYDLSTSTAKLSKIIINSTSLNLAEKKNYVNRVNEFLVAKYNLELSETKQQVLKNKLMKQTMLLKNVMKKVSK